MNPLQFVDALSNLTFENAFNPYANRCPVHDVEDAPLRRRSALLAMLQVAVKGEVDALWVGRDLGYRGGRRTGLALTDDIHMHAHAGRWGITISRPTQGRLIAERTAAIIWSVLSEIEAPVFLWNVFPLHPHQSSVPLSNRSHNARERKVGEEMLCALIQLLRPRRLVAVGQDATTSARRCSDHTLIVAVRHPSYGGQTQFVRAMRELYSIPYREPRQQLL